MDCVNPEIRFIITDDMLFFWLYKDSVDQSKLVGIPSADRKTKKQYNTVLKNKLTNIFSGVLRIS